jgi:phage shock protein A
MSFFGKLWAVIRGIFIRAGDDLVSSSPEAIRATYATAIDDAKRRYKEMEKAVALLAAQRQKTEMTLKDLANEEAELNSKLEGSLVAAESDPTDFSHKEAGTRYLTRIQEIDEKQAKLAGELDSQSARVEEYKTKLRTFMDEINKLKREQGEMVAEYISAQQVVQLEDRLKGLGESAVDESLVAIREKVSTLQARAQISAEMRGATVTTQDQTYERLGKEREVSSKFDDLLKARTAAKGVVKDKERDLG